MKSISLDRHLLRSCAIALALVFAGAAEAATAPKAAPAAKAAASTEDWTGIWKRVGSFAYDPSVKPEQRENPPYRPDWQARYEEALKSAAEGKFNADPTASCLLAGMPRMMNMVYPMEIIQKPKQMTIIAEWDRQIRRIFLDGRKHPDDLDPTFNGHSIGHWEGKTLVVDTVGLRDDTVFDQSGIRHSAQLHLIERFRLVKPDTLELEITAEDPIAFYKPWVVVKTYVRAPGVEMMEYVCQENNRNPIGPDGAPLTILQGNSK